MVTQAVLDKFRLWKSDVRAYCRDLLKVLSMKKGIVPFVLNDIQDLLFDILDDIARNGRLVRVVVLKARREGISTAVAGRFFHNVVTNQHRFAMMITHEPQASEFIFEMHKRFFSHLPDGMKPSVMYNNQRKLEFNKKGGGGLDSAIRVATAGKEDVGSGQLIHNLHCSEVAKWPAHTAKDIFTSVLQCVPKEPGTEIILESTAKGIGGEFYERFKDSRYRYVVYLDDGKPKFKVEINPDADETNEWASIFFPWFAFKEYSMPLPAGFVMTEQEKALKDLHGLSSQQIAWRRWCLTNNCNGSEDILAQEYPSTPEEAFLSSGSPVFDAIKVMAAIKACTPPIIRYDCQYATGNFVSDQNGQLQVWKEPKPGTSYIISADVAEGIEVASDTDERSRYDFSVADVIDQLTGEQVAHWHGKLAPDLFAQVLYHMGRRYNMAWLAPERNNHGNTVVLKLFDMGYKKLYVERVPDPPNKPRKRYGWLTSRSTKPVIIDGLAAEIRDGSHGIRCKDTLQEMLGFKRDPDGEMGAEKGRHDDRVMSISIAKHVRTRLPLPSGVTKKPTDFFMPTPQPAAPPPSTKAWL